MKNVIFYQSRHGRFYLHLFLQQSVCIVARTRTVLWMELTQPRPQLTLAYGESVPHWTWCPHPKGMGAALSELDSSWAGGCLVHTEQAFFLNHLLRIWAVVWSWEKGAIFVTVAFIKMLLCFFLAAEPVSPFLCCPGAATHSVLITKDLLSFESLQQVLYIFDSDKTHNVVHGLPRLCPCGITQAAVTWHSSGLRLLAVRECQPHTTTITQRRWVEGCDWPFLDPCQGCLCVCVCGGADLCAPKLD